MEENFDWDKPEVAAAQFKLVKKELSGNINQVPPYREFLRMMQTIDYAGKSMIDVGCGVGHYSVLVDEFCPKLGSYTGCDLSSHMIDIARRAFPNHSFFVAHWRDVDYSAFDIVLMSSLIEVVPDWRDALDCVLAKAKGTILLHRMRITTWPTNESVEMSYGPYTTFRVAINRDELVATLFGEGKRGDIRESIWLQCGPEAFLASYIIHA